jgi:hypothetical protein
MAVSETTLRLENEEGDIVASGRQETVLVREGGKWKIAIVREWDRDAGLDVSLKDLKWLIGTWWATSEDRQVTITYEWDENQAFLCGRFTVKQGAKVIDSGTQIIGKDNAKGMIRSWVFQADGGSATNSGPGTAGNGASIPTAYGPMAMVLTATNIYIHVAPETVTWQAVNQLLDGVPVADTPPIKVTRQKTAK